MKTSQRSPSNIILLVLLFFIGRPFVNAKCEGRFINPLTDICWECLFPLTLAGVNLSHSHKDFSPSSSSFCFCRGLPPVAGLPLTFWEPSRLLEVTRTPFCLVGLGGLSLNDNQTRGKGSVGVQGTSGTQFSTYHVHYYVYPVIAWLEVLTDFPCLEKSNLDIAYMTEFDPLWLDDSLTAVMHPESVLFANPGAHAACVPDCLAVNVQKPMNSLFWCGGCLGSLYPLTGNIGSHTSTAQATLLAGMRLLAKLHRLSVLKGVEEGNFCEEVIKAFLPKTLYKMQIAYPKPPSEGPCHALGRSEFLWALNSTYPGKGEDFVYLLWRKRHCCLDAVKPTMTFMGAP